MKRSQFIGILMGMMSSFISAQNITQTEILGRPTDHSITVQAFFDMDVEMHVQYGLASDNYTYETNWQLFPANQPAEVILENLISNTNYFYRIQYRLPGAEIISRPQHSFHTQRDVNATFSFVVQADPHLDEQSNPILYQRCLQNQLEDQPDFMVDLGDFLMTDKLKNLTTNSVPHDTIPYRCKLLRSYYEKIAHSVPLYIALGNHEGESGWNLNNTSENIAVWNTLERKKYFMNPFPDGGFYTGDTTNHPFVGQRENYYAWQWGDALFVVLDPYWYTSPKPTATTGWRWTLGAAQYNWLRNTLVNSTAQYKFVFAHQIVGGDADGRGGVEFANLYEWGGQNLDGTDGWQANRPTWDMPIKDLLTQNHVNIFFHGHDHFFGKQEKDCLIYQETPQPSHPNFNSVAYAATYGYLEGQILANSGHIRVTVAPSGVLVEYVRAYLAESENNTRHNKDVSASYFIPAQNCYTLGIAPSMIWNAQYPEDMVYPNPFSKETTLAFSVVESEEISIEIYNINGQLIRTLIPQHSMNSGSYKVIWDGQEGYGNEAANGIYLYQIKHQSGRIDSGKIILKR